MTAVFVLRNMLWLMTDEHAGIISSELKRLWKRWDDVDCMHHCAVAGCAVRESVIVFAVNRLKTMLYGNWRHDDSPARRKLSLMPWYSTTGSRLCGEWWIIQTYIRSRTVCKIQLLITGQIFAVDNGKLTNNAIVWGEWTPKFRTANFGIKKELS